MRNPLESEEAAFRFLLGTIVYVVPIVIAAWISTWLGVAVFVAMSILAVVVLRRGTTAPPTAVSTERAAVEDTRRILVLTDVLPLGPRLREAIVRLSEGAEEDVLVICALGAAPAQEGQGGAAGSLEALSLDTALQELREAGVNARGAILAAEPLAAVEEAMPGFGADEVVLSVAGSVGARPHAGGAHHASADDIAAALRQRFAVPVTVVGEDG